MKVREAFFMSIKELKEIFYSGAKLDYPRDVMCITSFNLIFSCRQIAFVVVAEGGRAKIEYEFTLKEMRKYLPNRIYKYEVVDIDAYFDSEGAGDDSKDGYWFYYKEIK